jgi:hypothetical protein
MPNDTVALSVIFQETVGGFLRFGDINELSPVGNDQSLSLIELFDFGVMLLVDLFDDF